MNGDEALRLYGVTWRLEHGQDTRCSYVVGSSADDAMEEIRDRHRGLALDDRVTEVVDVKEIRVPGYQLRIRHER